MEGAQGPVRDIATYPRYLDISLDPDTFFSQAVMGGYTAAAYIIDGNGTFDPNEGYRVVNRDLVLFGDGSSLWVQSLNKGLRFFFFSGKSTGEPVAWRGPGVMNTQEELRQELGEFKEGTFIKKRV